MSTLTTSRRLAGIAFEDRVPPAPTALPRMDIAVFAGFAAAGPLHTPVPVESVAGFLDVFGPDLPLARDSSTGVTRRAHLAPTVRAFFSNGGRRCWVIRVADEAKAEKARVGVPGVLRVPVAGPLEPAIAAARSVGAWFDDIDLRSSLAVKSIALLSVADLDSDRPTLGFTGSALRDIAAGDLVRLRSHRDGEEGWIGFVALAKRNATSTAAVEFTANAPRWFSAATEPDPSAATAVVATRYDATEFEASAPAAWIAHAHAGEILAWPEPGASGARPQLSLALSDVAEPEKLVGQWLRLAHAAGGMWMFVRIAYGDAQSGVTVARVEGDAWRDEVIPDPAMLADAGAWVAEVVTLDVQARQPGRDLRQLLGLGLTPTHPRSWASLPGDEDRFAGEAHPLPEEVPAFWFEADAPRFPIAVADPTHARDWFIPLGLDTLGATGVAWHSDRTDLEREGLEKFGPELFLHEALSNSTVDGLANEAEFIRLGLGDATDPTMLRGLHGAWPIEEAALIAVPDAVHAGWERGAAPRPAEPQSSDPIARPADGMFLDCARRVPETPVLAIAEPPDAAGTFTLRWMHDGEPSVCFVLEEGREPDWSDATPLWFGTASAGAADGAALERVIRGRALGNYYYRVFAVAPLASSATADSASIVAAVRAWLEGGSRSTVTVEYPPGSPCVFSGFERSDWSNGVVVSVAAQSDWEESAPRSYDPSTWLAVSRALARLCGARGDAMALVALPGHARDNEALALQAELLSSTGRNVAIGTTGLSVALGARESVAWSYAALYHAWITEAEDDGTVFSVPPLGAIAGLFAARAVERGAWVAPANHPLNGVIALTPPIPVGRQQDFLDRQLNLLRSEPPGFLVLSQDTLAFDVASGDSVVRPINVRRLLILLRRLVLQLGDRFVFEPNDANLRSRIRHMFESVLATLQARGAFAGRTAAESFQVECGDALNPRPSTEAGRLIVQIKVAPSRPMAFLTIRLVQTGERGRVVEIL